MQELKGTDLIDELINQKSILKEGEDTDNQYLPQISGLQNKMKKWSTRGLWLYLLLGIVLFVILGQLTDGGLLYTVMPFFSSDVRFVVCFILCVVVAVLILRPFIRQRIDKAQKQLNSISEAYDTKVNNLRAEWSKHPNLNLPITESWYVGRLLQILNTHQTDNLGEAIKILETRLSNEQVAAAAQRAEQAAYNAEQAARNAEQAAKQAPIYYDNRRY